ncbi:MAG: M48 family peptidase [Acidobacteria bacterium]|nr:MAG: M48 family peptidase [Acidobacteriota bacterium]
MNEQMHIGDLVFAVRRSARRKTIGITVDRDGSLILRAPVECPSEQLERVAREKLLWTYTRLAEKKLLFRPTRPKKFIDGEGFYYLGESYRLLLIDQQSGGHRTVPLKLQDDWFMLCRNERPRAEQHFITWYTRQARGWLRTRVTRFAARVDVQPRAIDVRRVGFRWGSCSPTGQLNFHWRTILLPPEIIDYLVVHELVHLREPRHSLEFWRRVERAIPDYLQRKNWLSENGGRM